MLTHIKTFVQRIVSGDFGGEVHLWDLKFKDKEGNFEVTNHREWECHKVSLVFFKPKTSHNDAFSVVMLLLASSAANIEEYPRVKKKSTLIK